MFQCFRHDSGGGKKGGVGRLSMSQWLSEDMLDSSSTEKIWEEHKNKKGAITLMGLYNRNPQQPTGDGATDR